MNHMQRLTGLDMLVKHAQPSNARPDRTVGEVLLADCDPTTLIGMDIDVEAMLQDYLSPGQLMEIENG